MIEIIDPRCYFSDHFNSCRKYDCVWARSLDIRMLFYSFALLRHKYRAACPQGATPLYRLHPNVNKVHQVHTCTSLFPFVDGTWSECRGLFWVTLQSPSISPVWFWEVCTMQTIFPEPCTSASPRWTIFPSRSPSTDLFLVVNISNEWLIVSVFSVLCPTMPVSSLLRRY